MQIMPVVTENQHSLIESKNENNIISPPPIIENSISLQKFSLNFPQPNIPIEPLYPAELKPRNNKTPPSNQKISNGLNGQHSGNSSPLEIVGQTTGQLTKSEFSPSLSYSSINSFQIINPDTLHINPKPNAIVKPVRRSDISANGVTNNNENNNNSKRIKSFTTKITEIASADKKVNENVKNINNGKENRIVNNLNISNSMKNKKLKFDKINGSVEYKSVDGGGGGGGGAGANSVRKPGFFSEMANFAKELNQKLHRLRNDKLSPTRSSSKNSSHLNNDTLNKRPLFITTVPSGVFLPPAKEISPTAEKRIYAFSTRPRIFTIYRSNNNNYPTAAGYYTTENFQKNGSDNESRWNNSDIDSSSNKPNKDNISTNEKAKTSLNERIKRDVFRGSVDIRPYNYYRNNATQPSSSIINGNNNNNNKILEGKKDQNREPAPPQPFKNVMHDKRVIRGSNFSQAHCQPWNPYFAHAGLLSGKDQQIYTKEQEAKRRLMLRKRCLARNQRNIIGSPPPIHGRAHIPIQTEKYLEELFDRPPEYNANTQTDLFLQRPPSPPYIPAKIGIDRATQIEEGELFDFDTEAQPILDTLVGHSVQQSLIETLHEQEMAELKAKQEEFLARREAELTELRRLEEEERRLQEEKQRRLKQDKISKELDAKLQEEVTAAKLLQGHIATILPEVLAKLEPQTDFAHKVELESKICPWLSKEVAEEVGKIIDSREILTEIIKEIIIQRASVYACYTESETEEEKIICEEEEEGDFELDDDVFIRDEVSRMISIAEDRETAGQDQVILHHTEDAKGEGDTKVKTKVPLEKKVHSLEKLINMAESADVTEKSVEDIKIEEVVKEEVMDIIAHVDFDSASEECKVQKFDQSTVQNIEGTDDNLSDKKESIVKKSSEKQLSTIRHKRSASNEKETLHHTDTDVEEIDFADTSSSSLSDTENIVRDEIERIFKLPENLIAESDDTKEKEQEEDRPSPVDDDNTENDIIGQDDFAETDDVSTDEQFLRHQVEQMISEAEQSSTTNDSDNNDISYIS